MSDTVKKLTAVLIDPDDGSETVLGTVEVAADRMLYTDESAPPHEELLDEILASINAEETIRVRVPGKAKFQITTERYERSDAGFLDAVKQYLSHYYGVELRESAAGLDDDVQELK